MPMLPAILASKLIDDAIPWDLSTEFHIDSFLNMYSLHDSNWITLQTNCAWGDSAIAVIRLDSIWNPSLGKQTSNVADWPYLLIRFDCVETIRLSGFSDNEHCQRGISNVSVEHISEENLVTQIHDNFGASIAIQHFPLIHVLAYAPSGEILKLADHAA